MLKRFVLAFAILGLAVASAETYRVTLTQPSKLSGKVFKAGDYRLKNLVAAFVCSDLFQKR